MSSRAALPVALVVDDDAVVRSYLASVLRRAGYDARPAAYLADAVAILDSIGQPGIVVTDLAMATPGNGYALLCEVRRRWGKAVRVVAVTGRAIVPEADEFDGVIFKPVDTAALLRLVGENT
jgi:CheY-like chemotaxis protein